MKREPSPTFPDDIAGYEPTPLFSNDWWLHATAGAERETIRVEDGGGSATLLLARQRRAGLTILGNPSLTPRLVPYMDLGQGKPVTLRKRELGLTGELIKQLPPHHLFKLSLHDQARPNPGWTEAGFEEVVRYSHVLTDVRDAERVFSACSESTRRAIRKARKQVEVTRASDAELMYKAMSATFARQSLDTPVSLPLLQRLLKAVETHDAGRLLHAHDDEGRHHASVLIVWDKERTWYLAGGADPSHRSSGAMSLLLWTAIEESSTPVFDFEGSAEPGIARFFRGFGARPVPYRQIVRRRGRARLLPAASQVTQWMAGRRRADSR